MSVHSYTATYKNNISEKEAIRYLLDADEGFLLPDLDLKKKILAYFKLDKSFMRSFDLVLSSSEIIDTDFFENLIFVELKTTKKPHKLLPYGFFFGATKNEFDLAKKLGLKYKFCFVSLHPETKGHILLTLEELEKYIHKKRIQYQINLRKE